MCTHAVVLMALSVCLGESEPDKDTLLYTVDRGTYIYDVAFSPDGETFASTQFNSVAIHDVNTGKVTKSLTAKSTDWFIPSVLAGLDTIQCVDFSPDGRHLAAGRYRNGAVFVWSLDEKAKPSIQHPHRSFIPDVTFSPDGTYLASCSPEGSIVLWNVVEQKVEVEWEAHDGRRFVHCLAFSPDGTLLASGSEDQSVKLWDVPAGRLVHQLETERKVFLTRRNGSLASETVGQHAVRSVCFSPNGRLLISGDVHGDIFVWDVKEGREVQRILGHERTVVGLKVLSDNQTLISASMDCTIRKWDLNDGSELGSFELTGYGQDIECMDVSPDGTLVVFGCLSGDVGVARVDRIVKSEHAAD